jgi:hypothetical protein
LEHGRSSGHGLWLGETREAELAGRQDIIVISTSPNVSKTQVLDIVLGTWPLIWSWPVAGIYIRGAALALCGAVKTQVLDITL